METQNQKTGKVKFFVIEKGYGFITPDDTREQDYFFHFTGIIDKSVVNKGDRVSFDVKEGPRGKKAVNVTII